MWNLFLKKWDLEKNMWNLFINILYIFRFLRYFISHIILRYFIFYIILYNMRRN